MNLNPNDPVTLDQWILLTLWVEFVYDLLWNNREAQLKRRKNEKAKESRNKAKVSDTPNLEQKQGTPGNP